MKEVEYSKFLHCLEPSWGEITNMYAIIILLWWLRW